MGRSGRNRSNAEKRMAVVVATTTHPKANRWRSCFCCACSGLWSSADCWRFDEANGINRPFAEVDSIFSSYHARDLVALFFMVRYGLAVC